MSSRNRVVLALLGCLAVSFLLPASSLACSPPFEKPTIRALGPGQVVVIGTVGEQVSGGREFLVERWFNGGQPAASITIAFKEGPASGDCSYPVAAGTRLLIAPEIQDGRLAANLVTLQADPTSEVGLAYIAEATALYGPGIAFGPGVPSSTAPLVPNPASTPEPWLLFAALATAGVLLFAMVALLATKSRRSP
jgi:hypothetical protein